MSEMTNQCRKCGREHELFYLEDARTIHLCMKCDVVPGHRRVFLPYVSGLPVPTLKTEGRMELDAEIEERHRRLDEECDNAIARDRT
jgi:hypothetical protein